MPDGPDNRREKVEEHHVCRLHGSVIAGRELMPMLAALSAGASLTPSPVTPRTPSPGTILRN